MIEKLLGAAMVGKTIINVTMLHRFILILAGVIGLAVISAFLCCAFLTSGLYVTYIELVNHGLDPTSAVLVVFALVTLLTIAVVSFTVLRLQKLRQTTPYQLHLDIPNLLDIPQLDGAANVIRSFLDGLSTGSRASTSRH